MQSHSKLRSTTSILSTLLAGLAVATTLAACSAGVEADAGPEEQELGTEQNAMMRSPGTQPCANTCKQTYLTETTRCDYTGAPDQECMEPPRRRLESCLHSCPGNPPMPMPTFPQ
jgi:hypothetical protein